MPVATPWQHPDGYSGLHLYVVRLQLDKIHRSESDVFISLREHGIGVNLHYIPVHTQPYYQRRGFTTGEFPEAEAHNAEAISFPMYPILSESQQDKATTALRKALQTD